VRLVEGKLDVLLPRFAGGSPLMHSRQQCYREAHLNPTRRGVWVSLPVEAIDPRGGARGPSEKR